MNFHPHVCLGAHKTNKSLIYKRNNTTLACVYTGLKEWRAREFNAHI